MPMKRRHKGPSAWTALLAAIVLLVQGLAPATAMPSAPGGSATLQICTHDGVKTIRVRGFTAAQPEILSTWLDQFRVQDELVNRSLAG